MKDIAQGGGNPMKLSNANLGMLPKGISGPTYDRANLTPGIVHIGVGNFHRAHQAWYLHRLMQAGKAHDWAIIGAGVRAPDAAMRKKLLAQDCLVTLIELDPSGRSAEVSGSMIDFLPVEDANTSLISGMSDPAIRIVSLTVTEGGYYYDPVTGKLDEAHQDIQHDALNPQSPRTAFGAIVAAMKMRRDNGHKAFTCLSCDNLQGNGAILREVVVSLARLSDVDLADWIAENSTFPNSMVDCIVPATGPAELELARDMGIADAAPVTHENFRQWVIEDAFCNGRPEWEEVGATLTRSVHDYESMKLRILNAGHQVLANAGELLGLETIADCMAHPLVSDFLQKVHRDEIAPFVLAVPAMSASEYVNLIVRRFANPEIRDTTRRVAFDGSSRHPGFVLPSIRDGLASGTPVEGLALVEAVWARMCAGTREDGSTIEPNDPYWSDLTERAAASRQNPSAWLAMSHIYGDLALSGVFSDSFAHWLTMIWDEGLEAAINAYLES